MGEFKRDVISGDLQSKVVGLLQGNLVLGELDPTSQDLLIGISASLEKNLWMLQAQEID